MSTSDSHVTPRLTNFTSRLMSTPVGVSALPVIFACCSPHMPSLSLRLTGHFTPFNHQWPSFPTATSRLCNILRHHWWTWLNIRRPCSDSIHVTAPYKLSFYYYYSSLQWFVLLTFVLPMQFSHYNRSFYLLIYLNLFKITGHYTKESSHNSCTCIFLWQHFNQRL